MSQNWLVSGLNAVDSGLHLYWDVRRMVCSDDEDSGRSGQGLEPEAGQQEEQGE